MTDPNDPNDPNDPARSAGSQPDEAPDVAPYVAPEIAPGAAPVPVPASPATEPPTVAYTPEPEARPVWAASAWADAPAVEPALGPAPTEPVRQPSEPTPARKAGPGSIIVASLLSAVLASGGTVLALKGSGALDPVATGGTNNPAVTAGSRQPVTIDESSAIIDAAAKAGPAVVRIFVSGTATDPFGGTIPESGIGSGVIFDAAGWILTNKHVVTNSAGETADSLTVELKDGRQFEGTVYGVDTLTDLAIVKIDAEDLTAAVIGSSADLEIGQLAIAIGSPLGTYSNSVTSGIV